MGSFDARRRRIFERRLETESDLRASSGNVPGTGGVQHGQQRSGDGIGNGIRVVDVEHCCLFHSTPGAQTSSDRDLYSCDRHFRDGRRLFDSGDQSGATQIIGPVYLVDCCQLFDPGSCRSLRIQKHDLALDFGRAGNGNWFLHRLALLGRRARVIGKWQLVWISLFGTHYQHWVVMVLPAGGFFALAGWLLFFNWLGQVRSRRENLEKVLP